jgi:hypothetical protein
MKIKCTECQAAMTTDEARWTLMQARSASEQHEDDEAAAARKPSDPMPLPPPLLMAYFCSLACLGKSARDAVAAGQDPVAKRRAIESGAVATASNRSGN